MKNFDSILEQYNTMLDEDLPEQAYQEFLEENTSFIPREFVQNHGIHFQLVLRKLSFGQDYECDFAYLSKSSVSWNCVLVEIERPQSSYFSGKANRFSAKFNHAVEQIDAWSVWLADPGNALSFAQGTLGLVRTPLSQNPVSFKFVLVHGRRREFEDDKLRRGKVATRERPNFRIMTFDSLCEDLQSKRPLYVAARRNEFVEILSNDFVSEQPFVWMQPEHICISEALLADAYNKRNLWMTHKELPNGDAVPKLEGVLKRVKVRKASL